jgi:hypothetical protein
MTAPHIQTSFASGEFAPKLRSRVDIAKYHNGAALLRNFFVDYSGGGASTRQGTRFINQCKSLGARLIPFQPSTTLSYELEFGQNYIRFYSNGSPILEAATTISGATQANPGVITDVAHGYVTGDWVFISAVGGMTQLNGNYYIVVKTGANTYTLTDLNGNAINTTTYGTYTAGGTAQRVYTITSPFAVRDLFPNPLTGNPGIKFVQDVTSMIICHPSYQPQILTIVSAANWTLSVINFGATIAMPGQPTIATSGAGAGGWDYYYRVTAVDVNGQESPPSTPGVLVNNQLISSNGVTIKISWAAVPGAVSYNVYKASAVVTGTTIVGEPYGFIGNATGLNLTDNYPGINPDFSQTPPIPQNPFQGAGVQLLTLTGNANYATIPSVIIAAPPAGGYPAQGIVSMQVTAGAVTASTGFFTAGNIVYLSSSVAPVEGVVLGVATVDGFGNPLTLFVVNGGNVTGAGNSLTASGIFYRPGNPGTNLTANLTWDINTLSVTVAGAGYTSAPGVSFSAGGATATSTLFTTAGGNPGVPGFMQERLMLANQPTAVQSYNISQPGSFFNFNTSFPSQDDDGISGTIIAEELNDIRNLTPVPTGMIAFTGKGAWLINGGGGISTQTPITPSNQTAQPQGFNGANDMKPIKINMDALYVTNKGNYVRDLTYNLYAQIFTGADISAIANHLFFGHYMLDWAWSEEPFKVLWAIRDDGQMISLTFVKDQEVQGWAHHDTNGQFTSVCSAIENVNGNIVDAVYVIAQRVINGNTVQYVERMADRYFPYGYEDSWSVDCALQTTSAVSPTGNLTISGNASKIGNVVTLTDIANAPFTSTMATNNWVIRAGGGIYKITAYTSASAVTASIVRVPNLINVYSNTAFPTSYTIWQPTSTVSGFTQGIGQSVVGVADGAAIGPFVVSATGSVALGLTATKITLGLAYLPQLQTLPLEPASQKGTTQSKRKKFPDIVLRVADTLGLQVGTSFANAVAVKDFQIGAIPSQSTGPGQVVTDLVNPSISPNGNVTDGFTVNDPLWQEIGQLCIQQNLPYPATILGIIPSVVVGDE